MEILQMLSQVSIVGLLSLLVAVLPIGFGAAYALHPSESRLALMRPISLASIFGGLTGTMSGFINTLAIFWTRKDAVETHVLAIGAAESLVPIFLAFGSLTIAWLCTAVGLKRHP